MFSSTNRIPQPPRCKSLARLPKYALEMHLHAKRQTGKAEALVPYDIRSSIAVVLSLSIHPSPPFCNHLRDELNDTTGLLDLPLGVLGEVARANDERDFGDAALAEHLGVAEREQVEHGSGVLGRGAGEVFLALLGGDEGPELWESCQPSPRSSKHNSQPPILRVAPLPSPSGN